MKKFLSILGTIGLVSSATLVATSAAQFEKTQVDVSTDSIFFPIDYNDNNLVDFKTLVNSLTEWEFNSLDQELENIFKSENYNLAINKIKSSNNMTIMNNKQIIENYFTYYYQTEMLKTQQASISPLLSLPQIDWSQFNKVINLGFSSSSDYNVSTQWYGPSAWWRFWEWGWQINFNEGVINLMRLVKFSFNFFNGINFAKINEVIGRIQFYLNYLFNLDDHSTDNISVLYNHTVKLRTYLESLKVPFTQEFWDIFKSAEKELEQYLDGGDFEIFPGYIVHADEVSIYAAKKYIEEAIQLKTRLTLEELDNKYSPILNEISSGLKQANDILVGVSLALPWSWRYLLTSALWTVSYDLINADFYKNGVYMRFEQGFIFVGIWAK